MKHRMVFDDQYGDSMLERERRRAKFMTGMAEKVADAMVKRWAGREAVLAREAAELGLEELHRFYCRQAALKANAIHQGQAELANLATRVMAACELELAAMGDADREALDR